MGNSQYLRFARVGFVALWGIYGIPARLVGVLSGGSVGPTLASWEWISTYKPVLRLSLSSCGMAQVVFRRLARTLLMATAQAA
jgi:hypothetical protein